MSWLQFKRTKKYILNLGMPKMKLNPFNKTIQKNVINIQPLFYFLTIFFIDEMYWVIFSFRCKEQKMLLEFNQHIFGIKLLFVRRRHYTSDKFCMIDSHRRAAAAPFCKPFFCLAFLFSSGRHALLNCQYSANRKVSPAFCAGAEFRKSSGPVMLLGVRAHSCSLRRGFFTRAISRASAAFHKRGRARAHTCTFLWAAAL